MLTSTGNQYLRPEYLSPIQGDSIELDAKKSPLALLAQTCSQIGSDMPQKNSSSSLAPTEKPSSKGKSSPSSKSPSVSSHTSEESSKTTPTSFKPYEKIKKEEIDDRCSPLLAKRSSPLGIRSPSGFSSRSDDQPRSSSRNSEGGRSSSRLHHDPHHDPLSSRESSTRATSPATPKISSSCGSTIPLHSIGGLCDLAKDPLAAYRLTPGLYPAFHLGLDSLGAAGLSALTAKVPTCSSSSAFLGYAKVKTPSGSEVVVPYCRDPYCTGCQINIHATQVVNGTCPPGCTQCIQLAQHTKSLPSIPSLLPTLPPSSLSSLYPHPGLVGGSPHSEELLQHLRSHTSLSTEAASLPLHALHHPLLAGHLPRGYPSPPLSPLSAARYHPYAKPALHHLPPTASALSAVSLSALAPHPLAAYYSSYSLYARGFGAAAGLHP